MTTPTVRTVRDLCTGVGLALGIAALAASAGCKHEKKPEALTAPSATPAVSPYAMHEEDVPVPSDFDDAAAKITPDNVEAELEKLESDLRR